jgi:DNA-binding NarL/FixJ family response regulator
MIRILIVDDYSVVRKGLRMFLARDPDIEVVGEAADGASAIEQSRLLRPDVVVMDLLLPGMNGLAATRVIRTELPETKVLALTGILESTSVVEALQAGAIGFLQKGIQVAELRTAIKAAAVGQIHLSAQPSAALMSFFRLPEHPDSLAPHEMDVLHLLVQGRFNKEIARILRLVEETVKFRMRHILAKLGVHSRTQAVLAAIRLRIVSLRS